mmetsp:Transcript_27901/g.34640  ORF Transcript_27901/g.34640 Transcript_27901/m.34640 type:complete len:235 (+) Transcript_27901:4914-5618(+)
MWSRRLIESTLNIYCTSMLPPVYRKCSLGKAGTDSHIHCLSRQSSDLVDRRSDLWTLRDSNSRQGTRSHHHRMIWGSASLLLPGKRSQHSSLRKCSILCWSTIRYRTPCIRSSGRDSKCCSSRSNQRGSSLGSASPHRSTYHSSIWHKCRYGSQGSRSLPGKELARLRVQGSRCLGRKRTASRSLQGRCNQRRKAQGFRQPLDRSGLLGTQGSRRPWTSTGMASRYLLYTFWQG